ncbi:polysaccharide biosynthesis/export family protein [uncultured Algoriphagus sp.]|uniref:polysaccharide biosynthesis/export family protein n=1 Tax=uncultured Algoriphagus sp. TaxID=417365 RepID=UPI0030EC6853|tara:strand:+ start:46437 stop:47273 length:837 start_codon:yes stop_codon:yes gene_type:complete
MNNSNHFSRANYAYRILLIICFFGLITSCISNKKVLYLQNEENDESLALGKRIPHHMIDYRLQYNDIVDVHVLTNDEILRKGFSLNSFESTQTMAMQPGQGGGDVYYMTGYTVDKDGFIDIPLLGNVNVGNLTIDEAKEQIRNDLKAYIKGDFFVKVKLGGIRYSALGEFRAPGKYVVLQDRMTIFEAIANAGDLTILANRDQIKLIRQFADGSEIYDVNLNDRDLLTSDFYFIRPNDQLYAEPLKVREVGAGENAAQTLTLLITLFTFAALVLNLTK